MTAATVEAPITDVLEHPSAIRLADQLAGIVDDTVRRQYAARAAQDRRADLALYRALLVERYGNAPRLEVLEQRDELLLELNLLAIA